MHKWQRMLSSHNMITVIELDERSVVTDCYYLVVQVRQLVSANAAVTCHCLQTPTCAHRVQLAAVEFLLLLLLPIRQSRTPRLLRSSKI